MTDQLYFKAHGGPDAGKIVEVDAGTVDYWTYRNDVLPPFSGPAAPAQETPRYHYVLAPKLDGTNAFFPWEDRDLLNAYKRTAGEPGDPEAEALIAEIERRGLDI